MDKKSVLLRWQEEHRIPGKIQALFSAPTNSEADWKIEIEVLGVHRRLKLITPAKGLSTPDLVTSIYTYIGREHMRYLKKATLQILFRSNGKGEWTILLHAQTRGPESGHALNVFSEYVKRHHPEVVALHRFETRPWHDFDLATPPRAMRYDLKPVFGSEYISLATPSGHLVHALDWMPVCRHPYIGLPKRLLDAIHPSKDDRLLEMHCGSGFIGCELAAHFKNVLCTDPRAIAKLSVEQNIKVRKLKNVSFMQESADAKFLSDYLQNNPGRWTVILNPQYGNALPSGLIRTFTGSPVERIIHITSDPEVSVEEIKRWRRAGFLLRKIIPLDLNPSSQSLEIALFLAPDREGVMRQFAPKKAVDLIDEAVKEAPTLRFVQRKSPAKAGKVKFPRK